MTLYTVLSFYIKNVYEILTKIAYYLTAKLNAIFVKRVQR